MGLLRRLQADVPVKSFMLINKGSRLPLPLEKNTSMEPKHPKSR